MATQEHEKDGIESPGDEKVMPTLGNVLSAQPSQLHDSVSKLPRWKLYIMVAGLTVMTAANSAAIQSMNVAVGFIAQALNFKPLDINWIVSAYTLSSGCMLMIFIPLSIQYGHREMFMLSVLFYIAGNILCAAAPNDIAFLAGRTLSGIGACGGIPSGFGVLANTLPIVEGSSLRQTLIGIYAAGAPWGSAVGTIFGGLPTQYSPIKWRGIFCVLAGLGGLAGLCTFPTMPKNPRIKVPGGPDWIGTALITCALTFFLFALSQGPAVGWTTGYILALLIIGCLLFPAFVFYEIWVDRKGHTPMLRMSNFRRGRFGLINLAGFFGFGAFAIWDFNAGLWYAQLVGLNAVQIMLRFIPQAIGGFSAGLAANYLLKRISTQYVFCFGCLCGISGCLIFSQVRVQDSYWERGQFIAFFLNITCACFVYASSILYNVSVVVPSEIGAAGGVFQVMTSLAPAFGNVISGLVLNKQMAKDPSNPNTAFQHAFYTATAFGILALVISVPGLYGIGIMGKTGESARVMDAVIQHDEKAIIGGPARLNEGETTP